MHRRIGFSPSERRLPRALEHPRRRREQGPAARDDLGDSDIDVEVSNGVARLTGSANSQVDRLTALTATRATSGVRAVLDGLEISPPVVSSR